MEQTERLSSIEVSVVAPAFNEQENIKVFTESAVNTLNKLGKAFEIVVVDDGSKDETGNMLKKLSQKHSMLLLISHEHNMGYRASMLDGIAAAKGRYVATIDSDLQYDISDISQFLEKIDKGYDVVSGVRTTKKDTLLRRVLSRGFTRCVNLFFSTDFPDTNCVFRLFRREAMEDVYLSYDGFLFPTEQLIAWHLLNLKIGYVPVVQHERMMGASSFNSLIQVSKALFFLLKLKFNSLKDA